MLDLASIKVEIKGTCVKGDGTALEDADKILLADNTLYSLFKSVTVSLNGKQLENNTLYPLLSYMRVITESQPSKTKSLLANSGYWGNAHKYESVTGTDLPASARAASAAQKAGQLHMVGNLMLDLGTVDAFLLDGVDLVIRLEYAKDNFVMCTIKEDSTPKFKLEMIKMHVDRVKPYTGAVTALNQALTSQPLAYLYNKTLVKTYMLTPNTRNYTIDRPFQNHVPNKLYLCLLDMDAYNGNYKKNPLYIQSFKMTNLNVSVNNRTLYNISCTPHTNNAMLYDACIRSVGLESENLLTKEMFNAGGHIICLDMVPERLSGAVNLDVSAHLSIVMDFEGITENTLCVLTGDSNGLLYIDQYRNVITDVYS